MLGLPPDTLRVDVPSPFAPEQLAVRVAPHISTRWSDRQASLTPIAEVMAAQYAAEPGNYLGFFSSFDHLQQALDRLQHHHPVLPVWTQSRGMGEPERDAFVARFTEGGQGIGFAVLGGAFGEGIDLPGRRLIGAFIATHATKLGALRPFGGLSMDTADDGSFEASCSTCLCLHKII